MLSSLQTYAQFIYTLTGHFPSIQASTLVLIPHGASIGDVTGEIEFESGIVLRVRERIDFEGQVIEYYSYSVSREGARLYWYDPQPHPDVPELASTHPHHKHIEPDIKHHRVPAPGLSFTQPNLPFLIREIEATLLRREG